MFTLCLVECLADELWLSSSWRKVSSSTCTVLDERSPAHPGGVVVAPLPHDDPADLHEVLGALLSHLVPIASLEVIVTLSQFSVGVHD